MVFSFLAVLVAAFASSSETSSSVVPSESPEFGIEPLLRMSPPGAASPVAFLLESPVAAGSGPSDAMLLEDTCLTITVTQGTDTGVWTLPATQLTLDTARGEWLFESVGAIIIRAPGAWPFGPVPIPEIDGPVSGGTAANLHRPLAIVRNLELRYKLNAPYQIRYSYTIEIVEPGQYVNEPAEILFDVSPVELPAAVYEGRTFSAQSFADQNCDDWLQKNAIGASVEDPAGEESMTVHLVQTSQDQVETFQRGFAWLSCNSCGCAGNVYLNFPQPPQYFPVPFGIIDRFWIEHSYEASIGDHFASAASFTLRPAD